jgi:flagellar protein FlaG
MEVRAVGQGGQSSLEIIKNNNSEKTAHVGTNHVGEKYKGSDAAAGSPGNEKDIKNAIDKVNKFLEDNGTHAEYEIHDKFKDIMIKIVDNKTKEVIQELPPKKILDMVAKMMEMVGVLFDKKA